MNLYIMVRGNRPVVRALMAFLPPLGEVLEWAKTLSLHHQSQMAHSFMPMSRIGRTTRIGSASPEVVGCHTSCASSATEKPAP